MEPIIREDAGWDLSDLNVLMLDGDPPAGFDCGRDEQNRFLYDRAWRDHQAGVSATYLFFVKGMLAAYVTVMADALILSRPERGRGVYYQTVSAVKLGQLGVDLRFAGNGLGRYLVGFVVELARTIAQSVGCRYVTLDSQVDRVAWYEQQGFVRNVLAQEVRQAEAVKYKRDPNQIPVSMRFDLRRPEDEAGQQE